MDAFDAHANMQNPDIAKHLMAWTSLYDPASPMTGEVWSADGAKVNEKTSGFGAKFEFYDYPVIGKVDLMRGDVAVPQPIVVVSHRRVPADKMDAFKACGMWITFAHSVNAEPLHRHCTGTARPLHRHCTAAAQALHSRCKAAAVSA